MLATYFTIVKRWKGWELSGRVPAKRIRAPSSHRSLGKVAHTCHFSKQENYEFETTLDYVLRLAQN